MIDCGLEVIFIEHNIPARLKALRAHLNLTTRQLGEAVGVTASSISNIETGYRAVTEKHIKLICAAYPQVNEQWLRTGEGKMFIEPADELDKLCDKYGMGSPVAKAALHAFVSLTPAHQQVILDYLQQFVAHYLAAGGEVPQLPEDPPDDNLTEEEREQIALADARMEALRQEFEREKRA